MPLSNAKAIFKTLGYAMLGLASLLVVFYAMNVRSRLLYNGPDYSFMLWLSAWAAASGVGLLLMKKWALLLLFLPGIAFSVILFVALVKSSGITPWAILTNALFAASTLAVPIALLRFWKALRW